MARVRILTILGVLLAALAVVSPALASPPAPASGTGTVTHLTTSTRTAGPNVIEERDVTGTISGDLAGTYTEHVRGVIHKGGLLTFQGTLTFNGSIEACGSQTGVVTLGVSGRRDSGDDVIVSHVRVIDAASNTIPVQGEGTIDQTGPSFTYQVQYHCK